MLAVTSLVVLLLKYYLPNEKRTSKTFLFDVAKQQCGMLSAHGMNLLIAEILTTVTQSGNTCVWYLTNILFTDTIGMFMYLFFLWLINKYFIEKCCIVSPFWSFSFLLVAEEWSLPA